MRVALVGALFRRRGTASRLACVPAIVVLAIPFALAGRIPDRRMAIECSALLAICLVQIVWPTLLGWAIALVWFAFSTVETIELGLRPGYGLRPLPIAIVLVPVVFLLVLRPRAEATEPFARACALIAALAGIAPLFVVWP